MSAQQEARRRVLRDEAIAATTQWDLPDLDGDDAEVELGLIARAEALRLIDRVLVAYEPEGPRPAPWGTGPARQWWARVILPAAREHTTAAWWIRRTPRNARAWAVALDPRGAASS